MSFIDRVLNPYQSFNPYSPYASIMPGGCFPAPGAGGAGFDPFAAYAEYAIASSVARWFAGGAMNDQAMRPDLQLGLRMMMQQMNQTAASPGMQQAMQTPYGANELQAYGELVVMMALFMSLAQQMSSAGGGCGCRQHASPLSSGGNWRGGGQVNGGWNGGGRTTESGGATTVANGPVGQISGGSSSGNRLAQTAANTAMRMGTVGACYSGAAQSIARATGVQLSGNSAYMGADQLARSGRFREVSVSQSQLANLPAGAVVVWGQTSRSPHGHISVALGDGREASDHVQRQITSLRGASNYRVFVPADMA